MKYTEAVDRIEKALAGIKRHATWAWAANENMYAGTPPKGWDHHEEPIIQTDSGHYGPDEETREYIAACNPVAMRALLKRLRDLENPF